MLPTQTSQVSLLLTALIRNQMWSQKFQNWSWDLGVECSQGCPLPKNFQNVLLKQICIF